jgi:SagB-type dehydrogenase family enzyme
MLNDDLEHARRYHETTKHSEFSVRMSHHYVDWEDRPRPFKVYADLPSIPLPQDFPSPQSNPLYCISSRDNNPGIEKQEPYNKRQGSLLDIDSLAEILFFSAGITRKIKHGSDTYYMRAASATGALYPIELYVVSGAIPGLNAGVYHFCPADFSLDSIRTGDYTNYLEAAFGEQSRTGLASATGATSPIAIVFTSVAWRNAWKYSLRSYRHWFWDAGVIAANLLAVTSSMQIHSKLRLGFIDSAIDHLLCLENEKEATVAIATLDSGTTSVHGVDGNKKKQNVNLQKIESKHTPILPLSRKEYDLPQIWNVHRASALTSAEQVMAWVGSYYHSKPARKAAEPKDGGNDEGAEMRSYRLSLQTLESEDGADPIQRAQTSSLGDVILQRGSTRQFARTAISFDQLSTILWCSTRGVPLDFLKTGDSLIDIYFVANAVEDLKPGGYFFDRSNCILRQLGRSGQKGDGIDELAARHDAAYLCLEQQLFGDAAVVFFLMANLDEVLQSLGNRGYRCAQFEAGVIAGKLYLASYAMGIGASGSTFYDDAVTEYFSPHASTKDTMVAVGIGYPAYQAHKGKRLTGILAKDQLISMYSTGTHGTA